MMNELKNIIKNSNLSNTELKKTVARVLLSTNDMMRVKGMTEDVLSGNYSSLKDEDFKNLIEALKDNEVKNNERHEEQKIIEVQKPIVQKKYTTPSEKQNTTPDEIMATVELLKSKILYLEKQLKESNFNTKTNIKVEDSVYIIKDGEIIIIPKNYFNVGRDVK